MELTQKIVRELLDYNPETGVFRWRHRERHWFKSDRSQKIWNARFCGEVAGSIEKKALGYTRISIRIFGKSHKAHRVAWLYMSEKPVPDEIDHIDRDATNNKWSNLRESNSEKNHRNMSMFRNNTSGVSGVSWCKRHKKWNVQVTAGRKFNLGYFDCIEKAERVAKDFRRSNGFDPCHGMETAKYHPTG